MATPAEPGSLRIGTAERDAALDRLRDAFAKGQLTHDEFDERVDEALASRTQGDLDRLLADLPGERPAATRLPAPVTAGQPQRSWWRPLLATVVAVFAVGALAGSGLGLPDEVAIMGGADLDLTEAQIRAEPEIDVAAVMGGVTVVVPDGTPVQMGGIAIMGGRDCEACGAPVDAEAPPLTVNGYALMGGIDVQTESQAAADGGDDD